jgi:hypothetical protein
MRTYVAVLLCVGCLLPVLGCGEDPFEADPQASYDRLCGDVYDGISDLADNLATVKDEASLDAAIPKIRTDVDRIVAAIESQNKLISEGLVPDKSNEAKWKEKLGEVRDRMKKEAVRLATIPGAASVNKRLRDELERMTSIPRPQVPSQTAGSSGGPKVSGQVQEDLRALGRLYAAHKNATRKYASSWEEAEAFCKSSRQGDLSMLRRLRDQGVTVHWGMEDRYAYVGTHHYVLAYEKKTPTEGGLVLHLNGATDTITPAQLMAFLAFQVKCDMKVFGKSPPVPVTFAPGTRPEPKSGVSMKLTEPWPPGSTSPSSFTSEQEPTSPEPGFSSGVPSETRRPPSSSPIGSHSSTASGTVSTPMVGGGRSGRPRQELDRQGRPMIGLRYRVGSWSGEEVVTRLEPLFGGKGPRPMYTDVTAKPGYAVGAIQVDAGEYVYAIRIAFMRIEGDRLNTKDSYVSDWIGTPTGRQPQTLNSNGALVLGIQRGGVAIPSGLGLVYKAP